MRSQAKGAQSLEKNGQEKEIREFKQIKKWLMSLIKKKKTRNRRKANLGGRRRLRLSAPPKTEDGLSVRK